MGGFEILVPSHPPLTTPIIGLLCVVIQGNYRCTDNNPIVEISVTIKKLYMEEEHRQMEMIIS